MSEKRILHLMEYGKYYLVSEISFVTDMPLWKTRKTLDGMVRRGLLEGFYEDGKETIYTTKQKPLPIA